MSRPTLVIYFAIFVEVVCCLSFSLPATTPLSHLHKNYLLFPVMKALLRLHRVQYRVKDSGQNSARMDHLSQQVGQILELASGSDFETVRERKKSRRREREREREREKEGVG